MTDLMQQALKAIEKLPENEQDAIAKLILEEIEAERKWSKAFDASQDLLSQMADTALKEHRARQTKPLKAIK